MDHRVFASEIDCVDEHFQKAFFVLFGKGAFRQKDIQLLAVLAAHQVFHNSVVLFRFLKKIHRRAGKFNVAVLRKIIRLQLLLLQMQNRIHLIRQI